MDNQTVDRLAAYRNEVEFAMPDGEGPRLREYREAIDELRLTKSELHELQRLDASVVENAVFLDEIADYLIDDKPASPLSRWWWHLGKIRNHSYPAELLPEHLRAIYQPAKSEAV